MKIHSRIDSLDSIRGIAALVVVVSHYIQALNEMNLVSSRSFIDLMYRALTLFFIWAGHAAVIIFFVLSGYVLSLMLEKSKSTYHTYVIKRWVRLYIPYIFSILLSILIILSFNIHRQTSLGLFFSNKWDGLPQTRDIVSSLLFLLPFDSNRINFVTWSLIYEIRISLLFPIILFLSNRMKNNHFVLFFTLIPVIFLLVHSFLTPDSSQYSGEIFMTVYYTAPFAAGAFIFRNGTQIRKWLLGQKRGMINTLSVFSSCFLIFSTPSASILFSFIPIHANFLKELGDLPITIGASTLIAISMYLTTPSRILSGPVFAYLGKISYSLYLTHSIVLLLLFHTIYNRISLEIFIIIAFISTLLISDLTYRFIEVPAINLSRKFSIKSSLNKNKVLTIKNTD